MSSLNRNIIANYAGRTWTVLLSILFIPVYLRFMGVEAYGLIGFYIVLSSVFGILDLGIGSTINRELARLSAAAGTAITQRDVVRSLELIYWVMAILAGGLVILFAPFITYHWINAQNINQTSVLNAVKLMGIALTLQFPQSLYQGGLLGLQRQVLVNAILIVTGTLRSGGSILVLWLVSPTIEAFLVWQVASGVVGCAVFIIAMWTSLPKHEQLPRFRRQIIYDIWKYAAAIAANGLIGIILTQIDKIILSKMLTLKMFAYYSIAATVASAIWMIIIPFNTALFPRFVQIHEMKLKAELNTLFHRSSQLLSILLFPVCALLIIFSREILQLWMHDPAISENCHMIVSLLVIGTMLNGVASIPGYSAAAFGWPQLITYTNVIQAIVIIPSIVILVHIFQGVGAAIAYILMNCTYILFMVPLYFHRYLKVEMKRWYLFDIAVPAVMAFSICMLSFLIAPVIHTPIVTVGWLAFTGMMAMFATALTLPRMRSMVYAWYNAWI